jgi:hypothetical protein
MGAPSDREMIRGENETIEIFPKQSSYNEALPSAMTRKAGQTSQSATSKLRKDAAAAAAASASASSMVSDLPLPNSAPTSSYSEDSGGRTLKVKLFSKMKEKNSLHQNEKEEESEMQLSQQRRRQRSNKSPNPLMSAAAASSSPRAAAAQSPSRSKKMLLQSGIPARLSGSPSMTITPIAKTQHQKQAKQHPVCDTKTAAAPAPAAAATRPRVSVSSWPTSAEVGGKRSSLPPTKTTTTTPAAGAAAAGERDTSFESAHLPPPPPSSSGASSSFRSSFPILRPSFSAPGVSCSIHCPGVSGFPSLSCTSCHSLFHPACVGLHDGIDYSEKYNFYCAGCHPPPGKENANPFSPLVGVDGGVGGGGGGGCGSVGGVDDSGVSTGDFGISRQQHAAVQQQQQDSPNTLVAATGAAARQAAKGEIARRKSNDMFKRQFIQQQQVRKTTPSTLQTKVWFDNGFTNLSAIIVTE